MANLAGSAIPTRAMFISVVSAVSNISSLMLSTSLTISVTSIVSVYPLTSDDMRYSSVVLPLVMASVNGVDELFTVMNVRCLVHTARYDLFSLVKYSPV